MHLAPRLLLSSTVTLTALTSLSACSDDDDGDAAGVVDTPIASSATDTLVAGAVDPASFVDGALLEDATTVDCTLSGGTETTCHRIVIAGVPADSAVGPFRPTTITTDAADSGIRFDGTGTVYEADGSFILDLPNIYGDDEWQPYDVATGEVRVTDTQEACEAAARPDVDPEYRNYCVECSLDYVDGGVSRTLLIPTVPVTAAAAGSIGTYVGVSLNGSVLAAPAPVQDILSNYTIAAFDDCGGHVNPNDRAAGAGENLFIGCCSGEAGSVEGDEGGPGGMPPGGQSPVGG